MTSPDFSKHPPGQPPAGADQQPGYQQGQYQQGQYQQGQDQQAPPPGYGQAPYGQAPFGQAPYGQAPYGYGPPPYGQGPYGQVPYGPYGFAAVQKPTGWFVVNWLFFWPLAIYSLVSAWGNIDRALFVGDINGARYHADRVKKFGIIALCIGIGWIVLWIVVVVVVGVGVHSTTYCSGYNC